MTEIEPGSSQAGQQSNETTPEAAWFVWGLWVLCTMIATVFVWRYGVWYPKQDDWAILGMVTGEQPVTPAWLWSQHNEHRIVLPRLIFYVLYNLTGADFRSTILFNLACLAAVAAGMILTVRRLRGYTSYADGFFPIVLMHLGLAALQWGFQVQFTLTTAIVTALFLLVVRETTPSLRNAIAFGVGILSLTLCGANGLLMALVLAVGYVFWSLPLLRSRKEAEGSGGNRRQPLLLLFPLVTFLISGLYFIGYQNPTHTANYQHVSIRQMLSATMHLMSTFPGAAVLPMGRRTIIPIVALILVSVIMVVFAWKKAAVGSEERRRALGVGAFFAATLGLFVVMGRGRGGDWNVAMATHYSTLCLPLICFVYIAWQLYGKASLARLVQMSLFTMVSMVYALYVPSSLSYYQKPNMLQMERLDRMIRGGAPSEVIIDRFDMRGGNNEPQFRADVLRRFNVLRERQIGRYATPRIFRETPLSPIPTTARGMEAVSSSAGQWRITGDDPQMEYRLPSPQRVSAIRIRFGFPDAAKTAGSATTPRQVSFQLFWDSGKGFSEEDSAVESSAVASDGTVTFYIGGETVQALRFDTETKPEVIEVKEIHLLTPAEG
jgi:uncharacterized membrane protein YfbV (UPF0208 family)